MKFCIHCKKLLSIKEKRMNGNVCFKCFWVSYDKHSQFDCWYCNRKGIREYFRGWSFISNEISN